MEAMAMWSAHQKGGWNDPHAGVTHPDHFWNTLSIEKPFEGNHFLGFVDMDVVRT